MTSQANHQQPSSGNEINFCHLHIHSEYSLLDGAIVIKKLIKEIKERGHTHVALTDHSNMHGAIEFYLEARKNGITPIVGCEINHQGCQQTHEFCASIEEHIPPVGAFHTVLLAQNTKGYHNLMKIVSAGFLGENLKEIATVELQNILDNGQDIVALSSCLRGEFGYLVHKFRKAIGSDEIDFNHLNDKTTPIFQALTKHVELFTQAFGAENYYIELIDNNLFDQKLILEDLVYAARYFNLPIVATADAHYLNKEDNNTHMLATAIKNGVTMNDLRGRLRNAEFHLFSDEEILQKFSRWPDSIANTKVIAEKCSGLEITMDTYFLPKIDLGTDEKPAEALQRIAKEGLEARFVEIDAYYKGGFDEQKKQEYWKRLDFELKVIIQMGFPDYFLIVQDFICWAKEQGIPVGPGRGSGAGSLVAYSLQITNLDPIPYNLIFERFLNPDRISMPDFDVDFCQWRREEVIKYCINKYGTKSVAQITTFGKMQAKGAVKSVGRAMNLGYNRVDQFTKLFPPDLGITIADALKQEPRLSQQLEKDEGLNECIDYALKLEGLTSHTSVHAAGVVMSDGPMTDYVPIYTTDGENYITQYEMKPAEKVGLVKFDFLGLKTLTVIDVAVKLIHEKGHKNLNIDLIPMHDQKVFELLSAGQTCGVFQCESLGMTQLITKLKPSSFEDIIALVALFRPGPLGSGMVDDFVERKHGRQQITYLHPLLEPILKETYGMILYQEQVQKIAAVLASYTLGEADLLRRAMGKKIPEEMAKQKTRFLTGAIENKIDEKLAEEIFELMAEFAKYGFNKSHSAAYGLISYQTAYLKAHFPECFLAASLTCDMDNTDKVIRYIEDCNRLGFTVLTPNINRSQNHFDVPKKGHIDFALSGIKGVGEGVTSLLIKEREANGPYSSLYDLAKRVHLGKVGKKTLQLLTMTGALDDFAIRRAELEPIIPEVVNYSVKLHEAQAIGQVSLFADQSQDEEPVTGAPWEQRKFTPLIKGKAWTTADLYTEKKLLGMFVSSHPTYSYKSDIQAFSSCLISDFAKVADQNKGRTAVATVALFSKVNHRRTKTGSLMVSCRLEQYGHFFEVLHFDDGTNSLELPKTDTIVLASGNLDKGFNGTSLRFMLERMVPIDTIRQERLQELSLDINVPDKGAEQYIQSLAHICKSSRGNANLKINLTLPNKSLLAINSGLKVLPNEQCFGSIQSLEKGEVEFKYKLN